MLIQYDSYTLEPLFSKKLLEAEVFSESEKNLRTKIETLYVSLEKNTAIYYEGSALGSALEAFADSEAFSHLIQQLEICFEQLVAFSDAQGLTISSQDGVVAASSLLQTFLDKLKTDFFSDRRALLYGPGKKYIEILSAFINEPGIDLNFRILQIINLLSDEGLTHSCAEGCFTRLQYAADNLKNYNNFEIPTLYKNYLQILADEIIHQPILMGEEETITQKVAKWMNLEPVGFEIHVRNFILKKFKEKFNFKSIEIVIDAYINTIENFFLRNDQKDRLFKNNFQYLLKNFNKRATATNFINYLSTLIHKAALMHVDYMERIKFLEKKVLDSFGQDLDFSLAEVLSDETGLLKDEHCLDITITERLLKKGWLASDWSKYLNNPLFRMRNEQWSTFNSPFPALTDRYKLFYGNLPLSWISVDSERQKIRTVLQQEKGLEVIQNIHANPIELLNTLIQTPDDLAFFFNQLAFSQQEKALNWIETVPNFVNSVLSYNSQNPAVDDLLEPLLSFLDQLDSKNLKKWYAAQFNLKGRLQLRIKQLSFNEGMMDTVCRGLIKKTSSLRIIDFSNFIFYKNINLIKSDFSYLIEIDFSRMPMNFINFFEDIYSSIFAYGEIENTFFHGKLFAIDFSFTQLKDARFYNKIEYCFFNNAQLFKVIFKEVVTADFTSAHLVENKFTRKLSNCNWTKAKVIKSLFLKPVVHANFDRAKIQDTLFRDTISFSRFAISQFVKVEFYELVIDSIFSPAYFSDVKFYAELIDNKFNFATLEKTIFLKKNFRSIFSNSNLEHVFFEKEIVSSVFDYATGFEVYFKKHLKSVNFIHLTLSVAEFKEKIEECDFSHAELKKINFYAEIINVKFNIAQINEVLFAGNMHNSDFVASNIYSAIFYKINLNDINFINSNLNQIYFQECYLFNSHFTLGTLIQAKFENTILEQVSFKRVNLEGVVFNNIKFKTQIDFIESNLNNAEFSDCDLSLITFQDSNLEYLKLKTSTITPRQLFDNFYTAGLRDFSKVQLSEGDINKNDFLLLYERKSLKDAILSESVFKELTKLGFRNFAKTDLSKLKLTEFIHLYHNIEYTFSDAILPQIFSPPLPNTKPKQRSLSLNECLPKGPRKKRDLASCLVSWNDIDSFNLNLEDRRNFEKIIIDSIPFIDALFSIRDEKKQRKLVELIDTATVSGAAAPALLGLRATQQLKQHFYRVGNLANALQKGIIYEDIVMDFVHGDYKDVAINVGLLAGSDLSENFAEQVLIQSDKLNLSGKAFLSKLLKLSAPFLRRGLTTGYIVYDLVKQAERLAKGDKNALINCIQDSVSITFDVLETEIEVLEFTGLDLEISLLIRATGAVINALTLGGTKVYYAARQVAEIKASISLTPIQTFILGIEAFLNIKPSQNIQTLIEYNQAYAAYSNTIKAFLKENPTIKYYVLPTLDSIGEYLQGKMFNGDMVTHTVLNLNSVVYLQIEAQEGLLFNELNPLKNNFKPEEVLCNPYMINVKYETLTCDSALVIVNAWANETQNQTLFALEEGQDIAYGLSNNPSIFIVDEGYKIYVGGKQSDHFVVKNSAVGGRLDASLGSDLLDLRFYSLNNNLVIIDLVNGTLNECASEILSIRNFERILGRSQQKDLIFATYRTEFIDLQGGLASDFDEIIIASNIRNAHLEMVVRAQTFIKNSATNGDFIYLVPGIKTTDDTVVNGTQRSEVWVTNHTSTANHTFLFDYELADLNFIRVNQEVDYVLFFNFFFNDTYAFANHTLKLTHIPTHTHYFFKDDTQLTISEKTNLYAFQTSVSSVSNLIERYAPLARRLGITLFIHQSLSNEVIVIGHTHHQVLQNDLFANKTHLVANGGDNHYVIISDKKNTRIPISDVILYQLTTDETQHVLDLRELYKEFTDDLLQHPTLDIVVLTVENDLQLSLLYKSLPEDSEQVFNQTSVVNILLKQGTQWYRKLTILFNRTPLQLVEAEPNLWQLSPQPLHFDAIHKNIILAKSDIEKDNQIFLHRPIHQHHWLRDGSDLWLTTLFTAKSYLNKNYTILFKDFEHYPKMQSLRLIFSNTTLLLSDCVEEIAQAEDFQKKLTSLELTAWNEVSKHRTALEGQQHLSPVQPKVLDDRAFHTVNILTAESMTSSAIRAEGWLNSLFKVLIEPFRNTVQKLLPRNHQTIVALAAANNATAHHQPQLLDHCIPGVQYGGTYRKGITCYTKNMQMFIFPKNEQAKIASLKDNYSKQAFRPIECNSRPAVYFEGEKTNVFYVPEIPVNPLDRLNDQLLLSQVLFHEAKKFYGWCKNFFTEKTNRSPLLAEASDKTIISNATKNSWKQSLDSLEKQLIDINLVAGEAVDLRWINCILEDRREELDAMNQLSIVNLETINAFTENLQALQVELVEINEDIGFVRKINNTHPLAFKKENVLAQGLNQGFFNTYKENLRIANGNIIGLNARRLEPKPNELNTSVQLFYRK